MDRSIPVLILNVIENWFSSCLSCVKWGSVMSHVYEIKAGARQGGVLSPILFGIYTVSQKIGCHPNHGYTFVNSWSICKILSLLQRTLNFQQHQYNVTHHTLGMLLHYLGKLKNQKFAILMHVKRISSVTFLSSIQHIKEMPNVAKISAKINTMQNINILLFVRSLSLTSSKLCS